MRLVCPNCEAKYEVPDDAIPDTGRDVQCANCGHAWFQMRPRPAGSAPAEDGPASPAPAARTPAPAAAPPAEPLPELPPAALAAADEEAAEPEADTAPAKAGPAYVVDESVLAILREEAEREAKARRAEAVPLETQPDLGLDAAPPIPVSPVPVAPAPAPTVVPASAAQQESDAETKPAARRDLFPDVEEINSTLRPEEFPVEEPEEAAVTPPPPEPVRGFRSGFLLVMTLAFLASILYMAAPYLRSLVPALDGPLASYVAAIDSLRLHLDSLMRSATVAINGN
ncbi:zinc-ribbon domain-containing protein [Tabrizicola caldifontis]|uniref:zinc-ribbon domain-containing protein n=1 Tax=Tabrizicola caldifontis TaxID=2528036 RepID=UPI00108109D4|nr:zinc-ribbon domain-containing protein [Rhodobacter sp. YIM 73028]